MRIQKKSNQNNTENIFWITMTDLMTGLVLVFIVMFLFTFMQNNMPKMQENLAKENSAKTLKEALKEQNIDAGIDSNGVVKISNLELFEVSSYKLSDKGKSYLDKFTPAYLDALFKNEYLSKNLEKIIIQGHTDSQMFAGKYSEDEQYMKNMELSLNRAYEVANYMSQTKYNKDLGNKLRKMVIVEGASYSTPIIVNGKEDHNKSRRVELKLVIKKDLK